MNFLMPTTHERRQGRNSWTPEYALSDSKYAVRYRSTGNIFNLREYSTLDSNLIEKKNESQDTEHYIKGRSGIAGYKDITSTVSHDDDLTFQVPTVILSSMNSNCKAEPCLDSSTESTKNERMPCVVTSEKNVGTRSLSISVNDKSHLLVLKYWHRLTLLLQLGIL